MCNGSDRIRLAALFSTSRSHIMSIILEQLCFVNTLDNETTLKRFYIDKKQKCVRLHPENKTMNDILVKCCYIQGVAQHVIKAL